jgi:hypothetical protein
MLSGADADLPVNRKLHGTLRIGSFGLLLGFGLEEAEQGLGGGLGVLRLEVWG